MLTGRTRDIVQVFHFPLISFLFHVLKTFPFSFVPLFFPHVSIASPSPERWSKPSSWDQEERGKWEVNSERNHLFDEIQVVILFDNEANENGIYKRVLIRRCEWWNFVFLNKVLDTDYQKESLLFIVDDRT